MSLPKAFNQNFGLLSPILSVDPGVSIFSRALLRIGAKLLSTKAQLP